MSKEIDLEAYKAMAFLIENAPVAVLRVSFEGTLINLSPQFKEITGYSNFKDKSLFEILSPDVKESFVEFFENATRFEDNGIKSCITEILKSDSSRLQVGVSVRRSDPTHFLVPRQADNSCSRKC
ncbi:MAG: PAS domain S-box protein [Candidatus Melainabacteria bacterium]|nr:PAS domain S-box protein [Candidatus Melainabacteria bacterium]